MGSERTIADREYLSLLGVDIRDTTSRPAAHRSICSRCFQLPECYLCEPKECRVPKDLP